MRSLPGGFRKSTLTSNPPRLCYWQLNHTCSRQLATGSVNGPRWEADRRGVITGHVVDLFITLRIIVIIGCLVQLAYFFFFQALPHTCSTFVGAALISPQTYTAGHWPGRIKVHHICWLSCQVNQPFRFNPVSRHLANLPSVLHQFVSFFFFLDKEIKTLSRLLSRINI